jgi:ribosomal protein L39E
MPRYRFECIDPSSHAVWRRDINCIDDLDAIDVANDLECVDDVEIWDGTRRVASVPKQNAKIPIFTRIKTRRPESDSANPIRWRTKGSSTD